jgi:hypothetical protein
MHTRPIYSFFGILCLPASFCCVVFVVRPPETHTQQLVKGIGESKSKQEEDTIVLAEVQVLRRKLQEKNIDPKTVRARLLSLDLCACVAVFSWNSHVVAHVNGNRIGSRNQPRRL